MHFFLLFSNSDTHTHTQTLHYRRHITYLKLTVTYFIIVTNDIIDMVKLSSLHSLLSMSKFL